MILFSAIMSMFSPLGLCLICRKSEIFSFLNPINEARRSCQPHCFLLSCVQGVKFLYLQFKFLAQRGQTHFEGSKSAKKYGTKCGQNERKFQNFLEVPKWHENNSESEFRGENEIHELSSLLTSLFPNINIWIFIASIGKDPLNDS